MIESAQNQYLKQYRSLERRKSRTELRLLPLEGVRLIRDAVLGGMTPATVFLREGLDVNDFPFLPPLAQSVRILTVKDQLFDSTAFTETPQGILAMVPRPEWSLADIFASEPALLLVVDGIQDPGNLGTMLRTAAGAGASGVALLPGTVDVTNPKTLRAAMGAYFTIPSVEVTAQELLAALAMNSVDLVTTEAKAELAYDDFDWAKPRAVVIGNEGAGVSAALAAAAVTGVSIPMSPGVESLNAAIAMSVIFFEASRQRRMGSG